jgi:hypothetical protein
VDTCDAVESVELDAPGRSYASAVSVTPDLSRFSRVVVVTGHMIDRPERTAPRFPAEAESAVTAAIADVFTRWSVASSTLVFTSGARGTDIIGAELALARGAVVWLLLPLPEPEFIAESVDLAGTDWHDRFLSLRSACPTLLQAEHLGPAAPGENVFARNNRWCLDLAMRVADGPGTHVVAVWDGQASDGAGGTGDLVARARRRGATVVVIAPDGSD